MLSREAGIEIDYCPKCRGVWLDRGELDKIIERSIHNMHEDSDYYKYDRDYEYKRKRSFWRDMFDSD